MNPAATDSAADLRRKYEHQVRVLQAIGLSSPDFLYVFDREQRFIYLSPSLLSLWGKTLDEALGKNFAELGYPPDLIALHKGQLDEALSGKVVTGANSYVNPGGVEGHYEYTFVPVAGPNGTIDSVVGTTRDVSERRRAERERNAAQEKLRESEEQFRNFADAMPQLAWIANGDGYIFWYNRRWYEYTGTVASQMEGWGWQVVHDPVELPGVLERWQASIRTGKPFEMTFPLRGADGCFRYFLTRVNPVRNAAGAIVRWFGTNTDVQDQKQMLAQRDAALAEAEAAVQLREDFLSIASHELRTPLAAMMLHVQGLERQATDARLRERLQRASKAGERLARLISELLDVTRITRGVLRIQPERVDLAALLREACSRFESRLAPGQLRLEGAESLVAFWDPLRLDQLLTNLLDNAIKYGAGRPVEVALRSEEAQAIVEVRDHGIGIAADQQERIFERFTRTEAAREYGGFGLGLWIAKQVVDASGGQISVRSEPGQGSTFKVTLPVRTQVAREEHHGLQPADSHRR